MDVTSATDTGGDENRPPEVCELADIIDPFWREGGEKNYEARRVALGLAWQIYDAGYRKR